MDRVRTRVRDGHAHAHQQHATRGTLTCAQTVFVQRIERILPARVIEMKVQSIGGSKTWAHCNVDDRGPVADGQLVRVRHSQPRQPPRHRQVQPGRDLVRARLYLKNTCLERNARVCCECQAVADCCARRWQHGIKRRVVTGSPSTSLRCFKLPLTIARTFNRAARSAAASPAPTGQAWRCIRGIYETQNAQTN